MKKKKNKERRAEKKVVRQAEKQKKYCSTALEWSDIEMIDGDAIHIRDGSTRERIIGLKVTPRNIFIDTSYVQARIVNNLRIIFNKIRFPIYWGYVFVPVQIDDHISMLLREETQEEDPRIRAMIQNDFEKVTWFQDTHRELEFFLMLRDEDETTLMKNYDELVAELQYAGFRTKDLCMHDLYDLSLIHIYTSVKGRIAVAKQGEVLTSAETDDHGNTKFKYEMRKLKGAVFEVKAAEDISSPDNQGDILYHKGDLVDTITTDAAGEAQTKLLPLGKYQVSEKTAPNGFTHSDDIREVELVYEDQNTAIVFGDAGTYENERQKVEVQAVKKDADDQQLLVGAEITLYANRDVYNYDGDVIVKAGEKIETVVTGEDGRATFTADLPNDLTPEYGVMPIEKIEDEDIDPGFSQTVIEDVRLIGDTNSLFYATETKAPAGYASGQEVRYYFDTKYTNQNNAVLKFTAEYQNETTKVEISKVDITNEEELPGATLQIKSEAGKIIEEWISTDKPHLIEMLPVGDYVLSEKIPASGYTTATDVPFTIKDTGEIQKVVMKDDITKLQIIKTDEEGKQLPGNRLAIIDKDGKTVDEWITDEKPHDITKLVVGQEYTLRELEAAAGYTKAEDIIFIVRDTNDVQTIDMSNRQTEMHFSKVDETGEKELPGAKLQIIDKDGNIIDQWVSTEEQHTITGLSEGQTYVMKEISAPYGYEIAEEITFTAGDGQKVTMKDKMIRSYIKVNKVDYYDHKDILKVAEFTLYSDAACTKKISAAKTDTKNGIALFDDLTYGTYFIKETKAPAGYELSDEVVKVTVDDEWVNGDDKLRTIIYADKPLPGGAISTGDHTNTIILFIITGLAGSMVGFAAYKRRKMKKASD